MLFGKFVTGLWLVRLDISRPKVKILKSLRRWLKAGSRCLLWKVGGGRKANEGRGVELQDNKGPTSEALTAITPGGSSIQHTQASSPTENPSSSPPSSSISEPNIQKPLSLYPAAILGTAMTARGEIGFLIASLAATTGVFDQEIYLVITWAVVLCTIIGPLSVGTLVRRVKRLDGAEERRLDGPLGIWGVK